MDGILLIDKPKALTSHDCVDLVRRRFNIRKVGHAGTLDPMATGLLVMLLGSYTRSSGLFLNDDKEYEATLVLGLATDTGDSDGRTVCAKGAADIKDETIANAFRKFVGEIEQLPPMYSAVKFKGKKLYELARKGLDVERKPRKVHIKDLEITGIALPEVSFRVKCSKGTYIRQLAVDIGSQIGCGAHLSYLRRTRSGKFSVAGAIGISELEGLSAEGLKERLRCR